MLLFSNLRRYLSTCTVMAILLVGTFLSLTQHTSAAVPDGFEELSKEPFPSRDLRIFRKWESKSVFTLYVENVRTVSPELTRARMKSFMVAGLPGKAPIATIVDAEYDTFVSGKKIPFVKTSQNQNLFDNLVRIADLGTLRQYYTYSFNFVLSTKLNDEVYQLKNATIKVDLGEAAANNPCAFNFDLKGKGNDLFNSMLINPDVSSNYYVCSSKEDNSANEKWISLLNDQSSNNTAYRLTVYNDGLYKLTRKELQAHSTGSLVTQIPPASNWSIYRNGESIPVMTSPDAPDDEIFIPVFDGDAAGLSSKTFWVFTGLGSKEKPVRLTKSNLATVPSTSANEAVTSVTFTHISKKLTDYNPRLKPIFNAGRWVWESIPDKKSKVLPIDLPGFYPSQLPATVILNYGFSLYQPQAPTLVLYVNGREEARNTVNQQQGDVSFNLAANILKPGKNDIAVFLLFPVDADRRDPVSIQAITVKWDQQLTKTDNISIPFTISNSVSATSGGLVSTPLSNKEMLIRSINGKIESVPFSSDNLHFEVVNGVNRYAVLNPAYTEHIPLIENPGKVNVFDKKALVPDYIAISDKSMISGAQDFTAWHATKGLDTLAISTQEIYDAFAFGNRTPKAIQSYLRHQFYKENGTKLKYVFLVGEASDFQGDPELLPDGGQVNLVPTGNADNVDAIQGDQKYSTSIGDDNIGDFMVGRLSASTLAEVKTYFHKYMGYVERTSGKLHWPAKATFVLDDNDEFPVVVRQVIEEGASPVVDPEMLEQSKYSYIQYARVQGKKRSYEGTKQVIDLLNRGGALINYFGHGGPNLWSHERLFHLSDLQLLKDGGHTPFITCASCDNAWISYPVPPVKNSMGELLVKQKNGGAIALFGPVSGASPYEHLTLVEYFMDGISKAELRRVGQLTLFAKNMYYAQTRSASIPDQYVLIGDPAVDLDVPTVKPGLNIQISSSDANSDILITPPQVESGGVVTLYDFNKGQVIATQDVLPGQTFSVIRMPKLPVGTYGAVFKSNEEKPILLGKTLNVEAVTVAPIQFEKEAGSNLPLTVIPSSSLVSNGNLIASQPAVFTFRADNNTSDNITIKADLYGDNGLIGSLNRLQLTGSSKNVPIAVSVSGTSVSVNSKFRLALETLQNDALQTTPTITETTAPVLASNYDFSFPVNQGPKLEFVPNSGKSESASGHYKVTESVFLKGTLVNNGDLPAESVLIKGYLNSPTTGTEMISINDSKGIKIEKLLPGESREITFRWEDANKVEPIHAFLTATITNNPQNVASLEIPPFATTPLSNFTVSNVKAYPVTSVIDEPVELSFTFHDDSVTTRGPVSIEYGWRNSLTGETSDTVEIIPWIDNTGTTLTRSLITPLGFSDLYVKVNSTLEIEESNPGDNTVIIPNVVVLDSKNASKSDVLQAAGSTYNFSEISDASIRVSDAWTSGVNYLIVDGPQVLSNNWVAQNNDTDGKWMVVPWLMKAAATEQVEPITFRVMLSGLAEKTLVNVKATGTPPQGVTEVAFEQLDPVTSEWKPISLKKPFQFSLQGQMIPVPAGNGYFDLTVRPLQGQQLELNYFEAFVNASEYISPVIYLPDTKPGQVHFGINIPGVFETTTKMQFGDNKNGLATLNYNTTQEDWSMLQNSWRFGKRNLRSGEIIWEKWTSNPRDLDAINETYNVFQGRIYGVPKENHKPYINDLRLKFK